jgi:hypothetical protein
MNRSLLLSLLALGLLFVLPAAADETPTTLEALVPAAVGPKHALSGKPCPKKTKLVGKPPPKGTSQFCVVKGSDIKRGPFAVWYENGQLKEAGTIWLGRYGKWTKWTEDGVKVSEGRFEEDEKVGPWTEWNSQGVQGQVTSQVLWDEGNKVGGTELKEDGSFALSCGASTTPIYSEDAQGNWTFDLDTIPTDDLTCPELMCSAGLGESGACEANAMVKLRTGDFEGAEAQLAGIELESDLKEKWDSRLAGTRLRSHLSTVMTEDTRPDPKESAEWAELQSRKGEWRATLGDAWVSRTEDLMMEVIEAPLQGLYWSEDWAAAYVDRWGQTLSDAGNQTWSSAARDKLRATIDTELALLPNWAEGGFPVPDLIFPLRPALEYHDKRGGVRWKNITPARLNSTVYEGYPKLLADLRALESVVGSCFLRELKKDRDAIAPQRERRRPSSRGIQVKFTAVEYGSSVSEATIWLPKRDPLENNIVKQCVREQFLESQFPSLKALQTREQKMMVDISAKRLGWRGYMGDDQKYVDLRWGPVDREIDGLRETVERWADSLGTGWGQSAQALLKEAESARARLSAEEQRLRIDEKERRERERKKTRRKEERSTSTRHSSPREADGILCCGECGGRYSYMSDGRPNCVGYPQSKVISCLAVCMSHKGWN